MVNLVYSGMLFARITGLVEGILSSLDAVLAPDPHTATPFFSVTMAGLNPWRKADTGSSLQKPQARNGRLPPSASISDTTFLPVRAAEPVITPNREIHLSQP